MQKRLCKIAAWMMIVLSQLGAQEFINGNAQETKQGPELKELTFLVSLRDLSFDEDNISVVVDGISYAVRSLTRMGDQWIARASKGYCLAGHTNCDNCGLCHQTGCRYFVPYCNKWK